MEEEDEIEIKKKKYDKTVKTKNVKEGEINGLVNKNEREYKCEIN